MNIELPIGWELVTLNELTSELQSGKRPKGGVQSIKSGIPSIGAEHLNSNGGFRFMKIKYVPEEYARGMKKGVLQENDIVIVKDGATTGKSSFVDNTFPFEFAVINEHVFILRLNKRVLPRYAFYKIWSANGIKEILLDFRGAAQGGISSGFTKNVQIPLPLPEVQQSIILKIEELFSEVDKGIANLKLAQEQLKVYRQSVLKWAFEGKLTNEKVKNGELPEGWAWIMLKDGCLIKRGKSKHRPRNEATLFGGNYPFIQTGDIRGVQGGYLKSYDQTYNEKGLAQSKLWPKGTLCITIAANIGETAILSFDACFPDSIVGLICDEKKILTIYTNYFLISHKSNLEKLAPATAQKNINIDILEKVRLPVPNIEEQTKVIQEIESRLSVADKMEEAIKQSLQQAEVLRQSILTSAFQGNLI